MFLQGVLVAAFVVLDVTISAPIEKEKIDPVDIYYSCIHIKQDEKENSKSPILLIHGLGSSHDNWDGITQILALRTSRRVCTIDLRNHGESPWNNRTDVEALTVDIGHFLDKQNIQKINIIGHSLGGKVAVHYTLKNPERVNSMIVEDMRPNGITRKGLLTVQGIVKYLREAIELVPEGSQEEEAKKIILQFIVKKLAEIGSTETLNENASKLLPIHLVNGKWQWKMNIGVLERNLNNPEYILTESTGLFKGPAMFIYGTKSIFDVGGDEENIVRLFPNVKFVPVEGAGHVIHGLYRQFDDEVIKFLNQLKS